MMQRMTGTRLRQLIVSGLAMLAGPSSALAQGTRMPQNTGWVTVIIIFVLIACVVTVSMISSKRGHQD